MSTLLQPLRQRLHGDRDAGVSLAELLVVSMISSILLGALGVLFAGSLKATRQASTHTAATAEARLAVDTVARRLRVALKPSPTGAAFTESKATSMTFYASLSTPGSTADVAPSLVRYQLDSGAKCLRETITPASGPVRSQCLAYGDVAPSFSYYQVAKRPTKIAPSPSAVPAAAMPYGMDGNLLEPGKVGSVSLSLTVKDLRAAASDRPVEARTRVLLVNALNEESM